MSDIQDSSSEDTRTQNRKHQPQTRKRKHEQCVSVSQVDCATVYQDQCATVSQAIRIGNWDVLQQLLDSGHPIDVKDNRGWTALHEAAYGNFVDCLKILLERRNHWGNLKEYVNMQAFDGPTALFLAAVQGHFECVDLLLKHEADPDITDHMNVTPLHAAVMSTNILCIQSIIEHKANLNCKQFTGSTPLHYAVQKDLPEVVALLLENGAVSECVDENGISPLFLAAQFGRAQCLELLLNALDPQECLFANCCAEDGASPLYLAAQEGHTDCVRMLLEHGANPNLATLVSPIALPLHAATQFNHIDCIDMLMPVTNMEIVYSTTTPFYFSMYDSIDTTAMIHLINGGLDVNRRFRYEENFALNVLQNVFDANNVWYNKRITPLTMLVLTGNQLKYAEVLLANGAYIDSRAISELPPLLVAIDRSVWQTTKFLIERGANINIYHPKVIGNMSILACLKNWKILKFLLKCGAEVDSLFRYQDDIDEEQSINDSNDDDDDDFEDCELRLHPSHGQYRRSVLLHKCLANLRWSHSRQSRSSCHSQAQIVFRILQFTGNVKLDPRLHSQTCIDSDEDWRKLTEMTDSPRSLLHSSRLAVRRCLRPQEFLNNLRCFSTLPTILVNYLLFKEIDDY